MTRALPEARYLGRFIATSPSVTLRQRSPAALARRISRILPSETLGSHLHYSPEAAAALARINALHLFIYRDPRDVLVSEAHYLGEMNRWHRMHRHFARLPGSRERLQLALDGFDSRYPECNARLLPYAGWLQDPGTLAIRYEDLAGAGQEAQLARIIAGFAARSTAAAGSPEALLETLKSAIAPSKSHTFRRGGSGKWRDGLSAQEAAGLTRRLRPSLQAFGYSE